MAIKKSMAVLRANSIGEFICRDGRVVKILDEEHWLVPISYGTIEQQQLVDFTKLPLGGFLLNGLKRSPASMVAL